MKHYCMKCGFSSPYINLLPPAKCAKCGFSVKGEIIKPVPKKIYEIPDLDPDQIAAISRKPSGFSPKSNPFSLNDEDFSDQESGADVIPQGDEDPIVPPPRGAKRERVQREPQEPSKTIKIKPSKIKKRKGRKTSEADLKRILSEGGPDSTITY